MEKNHLCITKALYYLTCTCCTVFILHAGILSCNCHIAKVGKLNYSMLPSGWSEDLVTEAWKQDMYAACQKAGLSKEVLEGSQRRKTLSNSAHEV